MKPISFPEQNLLVPPTAQGYDQLPVWKEYSPSGRAVICWKLSKAERLKLLATGVLWQETLTEGSVIQTQRLRLDKPDMSGSSTNR